MYVCKKPETGEKSSIEAAILKNLARFARIGMWNEKSN